MRLHGFPISCPDGSWIKFLSSNKWNHSSALSVLARLKPLQAPASAFVYTLANIPFFDLGRRMGDPHQFLCFIAPSFAEYALFCYAVCKDPDGWALFTGIEIMPQWKHKDGDCVSFFRKLLDDFRDRKMLGKLRKIGNTAPLDYGFTNGSLEETSYSFFCKVCDTNGSHKKMKPIDRLELFVKGWFPTTLFSVTESDKAVRAYQFPVEFC